MAQQETDEQINDGFVVDTEDCEERERAHRERGTSRPITVVGNPVLHRECKDVTEFDAELAQLIDDMFASQRTAEGVGLAANQIGVDLKVFVYDCMDDEGVRHVGHVVNPVLQDLPADRRHLDDSNEGCLSVPTAYASLARPDYAEVHGKDMHGNDIKVRGTGYFKSPGLSQASETMARTQVAPRTMSEGAIRYFSIM